MKKTRIKESAWNYRYKDDVTGIEYMWRASNYKDKEYTLVKFRNGLVRNIYPNTFESLKIVEELIDKEIKLLEV